MNKSIHKTTLAFLSWMPIIAALIYVGCASVNQDVYTRDIRSFEGLIPNSLKNYRGKWFDRKASANIDASTGVPYKWQQFRLANARILPASEAVTANLVFTTPANKWIPYGIPSSRIGAFKTDVPEHIEVSAENFEFFARFSKEFDLAPIAIESLLRVSKSNDNIMEFAKVCGKTDLHPLSAKMLLKRFHTIESIRKNIDFPPKSEDVEIEISIGYCMDNESRTWHFADGSQVSGRWITVNEDGNLSRICLPCANGGNDKEWVVHIDTLKPADQDYIRDKIKKYKEMGRNVWFDGYYISQKNKDGLVEAVKLVEEKTYGTRHPYYEIFQVFGTMGALARVTHFPKDDVFYLCDYVQGVAADGEVIRWPSLYWASTYTYRNRLGVIVTVPTYSSDLRRAINRVRCVLNLYDATDPMLSNEVAQIPPQKNTKKSESAPGDIELTGFGSGFFVTPDGYLLTNHHVVDGAKKLEIMMGDEEKKVFEARIIDDSADLDLALLKVSITNTTYLSLSSAKTENLGQPVYAVGYPLPEVMGVEPKITKGIISSLKGCYDDTHHYQIDAAIQPGNSGGPVCGMDGTIIGVSCSGLKTPKDMVNDRLSVQNVGYAIKKAFVQAFLDSTPSCKYSIEEEQSANSGVEYDEAAASRMCAATVLVRVYK